MLRKFLIALTDKLSDLSLMVGSEKLFILFFNWHWLLTWPERERKAREWIRKALRGEGER